MFKIETEQRTKKIVLISTFDRENPTRSMVQPRYITTLVFDREFNCDF
jgi:hypothetical protein